MNSVTVPLNEALTSAAFSKQSLIFDQIYSANSIVNYKRERVRKAFLNQIQPYSSILELNSGTGEDAIYFAGQGHTVHATDLSSGMMEQLRRKAKTLIDEQSISTEICSFTNLATLKKPGPYDAIFSNFGGLNCTGDLDKVLASFDNLLKPGGTATLVIISKFSLWEFLLAFKGKFKTATRRFASKNGRKCKIDDEYFTCWYYSPGYVIKLTPQNLELTGLEGLCTIVPPSYIEGFAEKHPHIYKMLCSLENRLKSFAPFKFWGDYFIISFKKRV